MSAFTSTHRRLLVAVLVLLVITLVGLISLWPRDGALPEAGEPLEALVDARIVEVVLDTAETDGFGATSGEVATVTVELLDGPQEGDIVELPTVPTDGYPEFAIGDRVALERVTIGDDEPQYYIRDFQRLPVLGLLVGLFIAAVVAIGRWHGLRSLIGLALSLLIVVRFIVPAILAGSNPPLVALVGALAIMIVTLYLAHGVNEMTTAAVVGTGTALTITIGLALLFIDRGKITGFASDDAVFARFAVEGLDLRGLVLAGLIIAALGVLDDVTISQSSTVFALHDTDRTLAWGPLFARAMTVGRDHIASVVNTLFLAYAGASLALLVLFSTGGLRVSELVNSELIAEEIIKTVVGSLGLIAAVPLTTALAALVATRRDPNAPPVRGGHGHGAPAPRPRPASDAARAATRGGQPPDASSRPAPVGEEREPLDEDERAYRAWVAYLQRTEGGPDDERG
jgi:uncharacterized membrane protein